MADCKYYYDEFCVNDKCPMCADYCPVPDTENVCKWEERRWGGMTRNELIALVPNKPYRMPCCRECMGKSKKDCDENPLNCFDFYLLNKETIDELRYKALKGGEG